MIGRNLPIFAAAVAATALCGAIALHDAQAQILKDTQKEMTPGFKPDTGQINPGVPPQAPAGAPAGTNEQSGKGNEVTNKAPPSDTHAATNQPIPSHEDVLAALLAPDSPDPAIGQVPLPPSGAIEQAKTATGDSPSGNAKAQEAQNTREPPEQAIGGGGGNETTGTAPREQAAQQAARQTSPNMPIGSTTQTLPAKYSKRNDVLDRVPTMAWPLRLNRQERQKIYELVMADKGKTAADIAGLKPADQLPADIALNAMHPLPQQLAGEPLLDNIQVVKGKDRVLLVHPANRIVVDVIGS